MSGWASLNCAMPLRSRSAAIRAVARSSAAVDHAASSRSPRGEPHGHGAEVRELRAEHVAGFDRHHLVHGPGSTMSPALSPAPRLPSLLASQATHRAGLPSAAAPAPVSITSPCRGDDHAEQPQVEVLDLAHPAADHQQAGRGVVRHRVHQLDLPVGDPAVHDLDRGQRAGDRGERAGRWSRPGPARSRSITKASSASTRGCTSRGEVDQVAVLDEHRRRSARRSRARRRPAASASGLEVRPTLRPMTLCPSATRRSMLIVWIA